MMHMAPHSMHPCLVEGGFADGVFNLPNSAREGAGSASVLSKPPVLSVQGRLRKCSEF